MSNTILTLPTGRLAPLDPPPLAAGVSPRPMATATASPRPMATPCIRQQPIDWYRGYDYGYRGLPSYPVPIQITDKLAWFCGGAVADIEHEEEEENPSC